MSKFTVKKSLVEVNLDYIELEEGDILFVENFDDKERFREKIKTARAWFERPNWNNFNKYIKGVIEIDQVTGVPYVDTITLRDKKFRNLLKRLVDGSGEDIKLDAEFYNNVIPEFAIGLIQAYDEKLEKEKEEIFSKDKFLKKIIDERLVDNGSGEDFSVKVEEKKDLKNE